MADRRICVLHLLPSAGTGGIESFVLDVARFLDRERFEMAVGIVADGGPLVDELREIGVEAVTLGDAGAAGLVRYARLLRSRRFDIVHLSLGGRRYRQLARRLTQARILVHVHAPPDPWVEGIRNRDRALAEPLRKTFFSGAHRALACSHFLADCLREICGAVDVQALQCGVDPERFAAQALSGVRPQLGLRADDAVVGFVGRLVSQKGIEHLPPFAERLFRACDRARLVIAGDGPLRPLLEPLVTHFHERVLLLGERRDVCRLMPAFDVVVMPSNWEGLPIVALEAMAAARPVAAFAVDGIPEAVVHNKTGLLVAPGDVHGLADAVLRLVNDPELRARLGAAGRQRVEACFDARTMTRRLEQVYEALAPVR